MTNKKSVPFTLTSFRILNFSFQPTISPHKEDANFPFKSKEQFLRDSFFFFLLKISQTRVLEKKSWIEPSRLLPRSLLHMLALKATPLFRAPAARVLGFKASYRRHSSKKPRHASALPPPSPLLDSRWNGPLSSFSPPLLSHEYTDCLSTGLTILRYDRVLPWK